MTDGRSGFTLVEVLAALAVFGLVLLGLGEGVGYGLHAWNAQARLVTERAELDAVDRLLRGLVARMDPGSLADPPQVVGSRTQLGFTTDLPGEGPERHVDIALAVDPAHRLLLRWTGHRHGAAAGPATEMVLLGGIQAVRLGYRYPQGPAQSGWADAWHEQYLPRLVRIHLEFPAGDPRHWPDILAEPVLDRPRE